jgi:hypothetical protein
MSTEHAVYTIAFEHGIDIAKELDAEETAEVRRLVSALRSNGTMKPEPKGPMKSTRVTKTVKVTIAGVDVGTIPALKPQHASEAKVMAEKVYPTVYIFENSVRDLIERVLQAQFGANWWTTAIPGTIQKAAATQGRREERPVAREARDAGDRLRLPRRISGRSSSTSGSTSKRCSRTRPGSRR